MGLQGVKSDMGHGLPKSDMEKNSDYKNVVDHTYMY